MRKTKKAVRFLSPYKDGKVNWFLVIFYLGSAAVSLLQQFDVIDLELYERIKAIIDLFAR